MMKHLKHFEEINESNLTIKTWHISPDPISKLGSYPMWFTSKEVWMKAYYENTVEEFGEAYVYETVINGNILSEDQAKKLIEEQGLDYDELIADLVGNPGKDEKMSLVKPLERFCDGFIHWDYDPNDWGDGESILVFNPSETVRIVRQIKL
jgi:hypothetical protein